MRGIFFVGLACAVSGYLIQAAENGGAAAFDGEILEEAHEVLAELFLILVGLHLLGVLADSSFHPKAKTLRSIFTGQKDVQAESAKTNAFQKAFAALWLALPFLMFLYGNQLGQANGAIGNGQDEHQERRRDHDDDD